MTIKFKQLVEGIKPETKKEVQQIDEQVEIVEEETVEAQPEAKTYSTFTQWLSEACSKKMKEEKEDQEGEEDRADKKVSKDGRKIRAGTVKFNNGEEDGKRLGEETDDQHYAKQSKPMQDAINLHLRKGKSYKDAVAAAQKHVKEDLDEGQVVKTKTGIVHKGTYGSEYETDEEGNEKKKEAPAVKRGRGRPKKGSDETGNVKKFTIHPALAKFGAPRK